MTENTSILLVDYFYNSINKQIKSGKYTSNSTVVRATFRLFENNKSEKSERIKELKKREESKFSTDFNRETFKQNLHQNILLNNER